MKKQKTKVVALYSLAAIAYFLAICPKAMALEPRVWWWNNTSGENDPGIALSWEVEVPTTYSFEGEMHETYYSTGECTCEVYRGDTKIGEVGPIDGQTYYFQDTGARVPDEYSYWINVVSGPAKFMSEPTSAIRCAKSCSVSASEDSISFLCWGGETNVTVSAQWEILKAETVYGANGEPNGMRYWTEVSPVSWEAVSDAEWLSVSTGEKTLTISASEIDSDQPRSGTVDILVHGWKMKTITVTQTADSSISYRIKWGDPNGLPQGEYDGPGCRLLFTDEIAERVPSGNGYGFIYKYSIGGNPYTIYRDGVAIANGITAIDGWNWFYDANIEPGDYVYEVKLIIPKFPVEERPTTGPSEKSCVYTYYMELSEDEVAFDKTGGERSVSVDIYKKTSTGSYKLGYYECYFIVTCDCDWIEAYRGDDYDRKRHSCEIKVEANDSDSPREGIVNLDLDYAVFKIKVTQEGAAETISYQPWAVENGVTGAWNEKDQYGIYNCFRYLFDVPSGTFEQTPLIDISIADGKAIVSTPSIVNNAGFYVRIAASDNPDGTGNATDYPIDAGGVTRLEEETGIARFYRIKVDVIGTTIPGKLILHASDD